MIGAFAYLMGSSARNRLASQLRQLRNPRYLIALLLGLGYFWLVFFNPSARNGRQASPLASDAFTSLFPILIMAYVAAIWVFGADRSALAFSEAEVSMLFTAPISRRGLIVYKLARAQAGVLTTSLLWFVLFHRQGTGVTRLVGSWLFLTTFSLHRLGVALLRASQAEHGVRGLRRRWLPAAVFGAAVTVVVSALVMARSRFYAADTAGIGQVIVAEFAASPLRWVLYPFRVAVTPMFAPGGTAWLAAVAPALALFALHVLWVLRSDSAFEETAVEASAAHARRAQALRTRGASGGVISAKAARRSLPLAPIGAPATALVWKNVLWLMRTGQLRSLFGIPAAALVACLVFAGRSPTAEAVVIAVCLVVAGVTVVFGPATMRNDLRSELRRLPMLKTMPLQGREIMLAEVASSALPTALLQLLMATVALLALSFIPEAPVPVEVRIGLLLAAPVLLAGLSFANFTIHNGMALLFPAWVRLGATGGAGVEQMGQMMLTSIITLTLLAALCVAPALLAAGVYFTLHWPPLFAVAGAGIAAGTAFGLEAYGLMTVLGRVLDRLGAMQVL
ncbi:MAG: putative ABC exporter domain-containing protein [bacterium]